MLARILEKFAASAIAAFSAVLMLALLFRLTSRYWAWRLTLVYALATATWSIASQALWQHTTVELAIVGALYFLEAGGAIGNRRERCGFAGRARLAR